MTRFRSKEKKGKRRVKPAKTPRAKKKAANNFPRIFSILLIAAFALLGYRSANLSFGTKNSYLTKDYMNNSGSVAGTSSERTSQNYFSRIINEPVLKQGALVNDAPDITARSALVLDVPSGKILFEKNKDMPLPPASTTKIVTALIAHDNFDLQSRVAVPPFCVGLEGNNVGFVQGDVLTVESLLYGLLVKSASDAACTLANIGGDYEGFIAKMNKKASDLGLTHTHFANEVGLDDIEDKHLSTSSDLAILAEKAMENGIFRKIVGTKSTSIYSYTRKEFYDISTTNNLLFTLPGTTGVKTGYTDGAKGCLVYTYENLGKNLIIVVMGSDDRFSDTRNLLNWTLSSYAFP